MNSLNLTIIFYFNKPQSTSKYLPTPNSYLNRQTLHIQSTKITLQISFIRLQIIPNNSKKESIKSNLNQQEILHKTRFYDG